MTEAQSITRQAKNEGDISSVFTSFSGRKSVPLPDRFRDLKRSLTAGFEEQIQKSWDDLVDVLAERTEEVATKREDVSTAIMSMPYLCSPIADLPSDHPASEFPGHRRWHCAP